MTLKRSLLVGVIFSVIVSAVILTGESHFRSAWLGPMLPVAAAAAFPGTATIAVFAAMHFVPSTTPTWVVYLSVVAVNTAFYGGVLFCAGRVLGFGKKRRDPATR